MIIIILTASYIDDDVLVVLVLVVLVLVVLVLVVLVLLLLLILVDRIVHWG